jgi:hypothetical protein
MKDEMGGALGHYGEEDRCMVGFGTDTERKVKI